jgi:hypothetical protein
MGWQYYNGTPLWSGNQPAWDPSCCCYLPPGLRDCEYYRGNDSALDAHPHASGVTVNIQGFGPAFARPPDPITRDTCCELSGGSFFLPIRDFDDPAFNSQIGCVGFPCAAFARDTCGVAECYFDPGTPDQEEFGWRLDAQCFEFFEGSPFWFVKVRQGVLIADPEGPPDPPFACDFVSQAWYQILTPAPPYPATHAGIFMLDRVPDPFYSLASPQCCEFPDQLQLWAPA